MVQICRLYAWVGLITGVFPISRDWRSYLRICFVEDRFMFVQFCLWDAIQRTKPVDGDFNIEFVICVLLLMPFAVPHLCLVVYEDGLQISTYTGLNMYFDTKRKRRASRLTAACVSCLDWTKIKALHLDYFSCGIVPVYLFICPFQARILTVESVCIRSNRYLCLTCLVRFT
jgi:hypothetical protein